MTLALPEGATLRGRTMFKVGLAELPVHTRYSPTATVQAGLGTALAARVDSYWIADHLNSLFPCSMMTPKYFGGARLSKADAYMEPWTVLGTLAGQVAALGCGLASASRTRVPEPRGYRPSGRDTASADERKGDSRHRDRRAGGKRAVRCRLVQAGGTLRRGDGHHPGVVELGRRARHPRLALLPVAQRRLDLPPYKGKWPEVWIASHMPRMLRITGRYAKAAFPVSISTRRATLPVSRWFGERLPTRSRPRVDHSRELVHRFHRPERDEVDEALSSTS